MHVLSFYFKKKLKLQLCGFVTILSLSEQDWDRQSPTQIVTEMCGFVTILSGTFLLHKTKDMVDGMVLLISCQED